MCICTSQVIVGYVSILFSNMQLNFDEEFQKGLVQADQAGFAVALYGTPLRPFKPMFSTAQGRHMYAAICIPSIFIFLPCREQTNWDCIHEAHGKGCLDDKKIGGRGGAGGAQSGILDNSCLDESRPCECLAGTITQGHAAGMPGET